EMRDQIAALRLIQQKQHVDTGSTSANVDVFSVLSRHGQAVVEQLSIRNGRLLGHKSHSLALQLDLPLTDVLETFLAQYYLNENDGAQLPKEVLMSEPLDASNISAAVFQQTGRRIRFASQVRGQRQAWLRLAQENAKTSLLTLLADKEQLAERFSALQKALSLSVLPERIECFDISHTGGEKAVAACVVFSSQGAMKQDYRRYNVNPAKAGDDYAALAEAVERRYKRSLQSEQPMPDLLLSDGGKGQVNRVAQVLAELGLPEVQILGISQAPGKKANTEERLHKQDGAVIVLPPENRGVHLLQQIRDEAHRLA